MENKKCSYLDEYRIVKTLGTGYSAKVKLAETTDHKLVAIKRFKPECANINTLRHELSILRKLRHENLVNLLDVRENATYKKKSGATYACFAIVLEYVGGGELFDFIALGGRFPPNVARTYFQQMMNGLHYMHQQGFAHRDIKPENILLTTEFVLKLADFGFTGLLEGKDRSGIMRTKLGTEGYMAPEIQSKQYVGTKVDIFASGVILFIMYTGTPPFEKTTPNDSYYRLIKEKNFTTFWSAHSKRKPAGFYTEDFKDLFNRMVAYNPEERISMEQIAMHPWARGPVLTAADICQDFTNRKSKIEKEREKAEIEKERKKTKRTDAIASQDQFDRSEDNEEDPEIGIFLLKHKEQEVKDRKLKTLRQFTKDNFVVNDSIEYFFSELFTHLDMPIKLTINEDNVEFTAKYESKEDEINIVYEYDVEGQTESVVMFVKVHKTEKDQPVLSFVRVEGNSIYYKWLVNDIKDQFKQLSV